MSYKKILFVGFCMLTLFTAVKSVAAETTIPDGFYVSNSCSNNLYYNTEFSQVLVSATNVFDVKVKNRTYYSNNHFIPVKSNSDYYLSSKNSIYSLSFYIGYYDFNFDYLSYEQKFPVAPDSSSHTISTPSDCSYIMVFVSSSNYAAASNDFYQIEEGTTSTDYVDYEECSVIEPNPEPETPSEDNPSETISIDYSIFYVIAILLSSIFLYKFFEPLFSRKG